MKRADVVDAIIVLRRYPNYKDWDIIKCKSSGRNSRKSKSYKESDEYWSWSNYT